MAASAVHPSGHATAREACRPCTCATIHAHAMSQPACAVAAHTRVFRHASIRRGAACLTISRAPSQRRMYAISAPAGGSDAQMSLPEPQPVVNGDGRPTSFPPTPGIYAVYNAEGAIQYVGMSRKVPIVSSSSPGGRTAAVTHAASWSYSACAAVACAACWVACEGLRLSHNRIAPGSRLIVYCKTIRGAGGRQRGQPPAGPAG